MEWASDQLRIPARPFLKLDEVAEVVGAHPKTVQRWVREGLFPQPRSVAGGRERWSARSVGVWLAWQEYCPAVKTAAVEENASLPETPVKRKSVESTRNIPPA